MKPIKSIISAILIFAMLFTFIACNEDDNDTTAEISTASTAAPESFEDSATAEPAETNEPAEDSATEEYAETNVPVEDSATEEYAETNVPVEDSATEESAETNAPVEDTTKAPAEDTTKAPTTKPEENTTTVPATTDPVEDTTKVPVTTAPVEDPTVDYSEWGKHGFENLLPIPLPFSDDEADWRSKKLSSTYFQVKNFKMIYFENSDDFVNAVKEYAESFESLGYTLKLEQYVFTAYSKTERFTLKCNANGYMSVDIKFIS